VNTVVNLSRLGERLLASLVKLCSLEIVTDCRIQEHYHVRDSDS
jgi:hypothetical protein